jgi:hypothetical protein
MSDTPDDTHNGTQSRSAIRSALAGGLNGMPALSEDFRKTLKDAEIHVNLQMEEARRLKSDPELVLRERENTVADALSIAKHFYQKKEYNRAFEEWERVCFFLDENDPFPKKIRELRTSHENLFKVNQELQEIKKVLHQRSSPGPADAKFVDEANNAVNAQVKNSYSYLSQQIRTERTPKGISFWWPVALAAVVLILGLAGLRGYYEEVKKQLAVQEALISAKDESTDSAALAARTRAVEKQIAALNQDHENEIQTLGRKYAEESKNDREKIIQLETKLKEAESENLNLERQSRALFEDNIKKDETIAALN